MNTTVGDLLLTAVRKDAEGAKRLFAQAGLQMDAPTAGARSASPVGSSLQRQWHASRMTMTSLKQLRSHRSLLLRDSRRPTAGRPSTTGTGH
jgi:hypothetical protein